MIEAYRKLWQDRASVMAIESQEQLDAHIRAELADELTHPRLRRTKAEKLAIALERIAQSDLTEVEKQELRVRYEKLAL
ncbi:hypothetical protein [Planomicrobium sp. YIM 101495]|uniref:hypothetical protein n=1 Tax=Planomicrobium sp. YIM 101495 TaxID=2665160 RepID=UPI0012B75FBC|nr:hypothetical protein [Planomicrobium sp. YIM 101495]MTD29771.1 hypothetical protein [Planomicrobium sp. YIM 101495]